jgi:hypothetical protein
MEQQPTADKGALLTDAEQYSQSRHLEKRQLFTAFMVAKMEVILPHR